MCIRDRTHSAQVARKTAHRLYQLRPILCSNAMTRRLGKLIVSTYVAPMATYAIPVWGYLAKTHKRKLQSLLDRGLRWACKAHYLTSNKTIREALRVRSLDATIRILSRKFYRRSARFQGNHLISALGRYQSVPGESWTRPRLTLTHN